MKRRVRAAPRALLLSLWLGAGAAVAAPAVFTVYAAGDIAACRGRPASQSGAARTAELVGQAIAHDPDAAVLTLGDTVYERGAPAEFAQCYGPTWGRFRQRTYPAPGNRDYATARAAGYFGYFGKPAYYSVELGSWHVISLDSNLAGAAHDAQLAWLKQDLAAHPARCTLAYWHHPLYSSGWHGNIPHMRAAWRLLYEAGAELVLSGHDHVYQRFAPQDADGHADPARGLREFIVGTGGAWLTPFTHPSANSEASDSTRTGVLRLRLLDGRYEWSFLQADYEGFAEMPQTDHGAGVCH